MQDRLRKEGGRDGEGTCVGWMHHMTIPHASQTFIKTVNYNHIMPTRYTLDVDFKTSVSHDVLENSTKKVEVQKVRDGAWGGMANTSHAVGRGAI